MRRVVTIVLSVIAAIVTIALVAVIVLAQTSWGRQRLSSVPVESAGEHPAAGRQLLASAPGRWRPRCDGGSERLRPCRTR
jgi:hypothetical protein